MFFLKKVYCAVSALNFLWFSPARRNGFIRADGPVDWGHARRRKHDGIDLWRPWESMTTKPASAVLAFEDCVAEVEHCAARVAGLEQKIHELILALPQRYREVTAALQSMRGIAELTAVT